jgi:hypothetical protein|tara:strand:+ start:985 stop:1971 length:987 start_codon:yes stop_codon:yes gene_type:complete
LTDTLNPHADPIDAVITWVDGNTVSHRRERAQYMSDVDGPLHENAINPHRWHNNDEILYCLQSIENFAPWTRKIWIVIDSECPNLTSLSEQLRAKISFVFHHGIFRELSVVLPTFNSLTIESMIWRIEGLSERFMYFNDDVFLSAPLIPADVFRGFLPVLRGEWVDYSELLYQPEMRRDPAKFNHFMQINAARIAGFDAKWLFASAHVVHPMRRSVMAELFDKDRDTFIENIKYRFRDLRQFLPQSLHNHACIAAEKAVVHTEDDHLHIESGQGIGRPPGETSALLQKARNPEIKFLCVNDLPQLEMVVPQAREWLRGVIGGFPVLPY